VVFQATWLGIAQLQACSKRLPDPLLVVEDSVVAEADSADLVEGSVVAVEASLVVQVVALPW